MRDLPPLAITIVTFNSAPYIERCVDSIERQSYPDKRIVIVDNASSDSTRQLLERLKTRHHVVYNRVNTGFAAAQNQAIALCDSKWVLVLNPDVLLGQDFLLNLVLTGEADGSVGTVCGKLLAIPPGFEIPGKPLLDSTGIFLTPQLRHLDRGSRLSDNGSFENFEFVFGATGAAALYRREMIRDVSTAGEFFDTDFFSYREDADVSWRAQLLGWRCVYCPVAIAHHVRSVLPGNRKSLPAAINMHSVKNRWLLRIKNMTGDLYRRFWLPVTLRDLIVIGACLTVERSSFPGLLFVAKRWRATFAKRKEIMSKRRASDTYMAQWIAPEPVAVHAAEIAASFSRELAAARSPSEPRG